MEPPHGACTQRAYCSQWRRSKMVQLLRHMPKQRTTLARWTGDRRYARLANGTEQQPHRTWKTTLAQPRLKNMLKNSQPTVFAKAVSAACGRVLAAVRLLRPLRLPQEMWRTCTNAKDEVAWTLQIWPPPHTHQHLPPRRHQHQRRQLSTEVPVASSARAVDAAGATVVAVGASGALRPS